jgi:hypothetical protein
VARNNAAFVCADVGFDAQKIGYFGLSILWRAAVRRWEMFDKDTTGIEVEGKYMESIRRYLMGETGFPKNVAVIATVATDFLSQRACFVPNRIADNPFHTVYGLLTKGLFFRFIMEEHYCPAKVLRSGINIFESAEYAG